MRNSAAKYPMKYGYARVSTDGQSVDDDPKSSVHFSGCAGSGTNVMLDGGLVMFG
jgi:hypothetical protein